MSKRIKTIPVEKIKPFTENRGERPTREEINERVNKMLNAPRLNKMQTAHASSYLVENNSRETARDAVMRVTVQAVEAIVDADQVVEHIGPDNMVLLYLGIILKMRNRIEEIERHIKDDEAAPKDELKTIDAPIIVECSICRRAFAYKLGDKIKCPCCDHHPDAQFTILDGHHRYIAFITAFPSKAVENLKSLGARQNKQKKPG